MDLSVLTQLISTVGFPIVMCILLFKQQNDQSNRHTDETKSFTSALNNNTIVLQKLCEKLDYEMEVSVNGNSNS